MKARFAGSAVGAALLLTWSVPAGAAEPPELTPAAAQSVAKELERTKESWAGADATDVLAVQPAGDTILVLVDSADAVAAVEEQVPSDQAGAVQVVHATEAPVAGPSADDGGWSAGIWLNGSTGNCTAGFAWKTWSGNQVKGSTAAHCSSSSFTNNGRLVGSTFRTGTGTNDVKLLNPATNTSFNADVWIRGSNGQPTLRNVQSAGANTWGETVAFYGRTSGGGTAQITVLPYNNQPGRVYMNSPAVRPGDSGGPVYVTHANGNVQARGTVSAMLFQDANGNGTWQTGETVYGMIFTDITHSSAGLQATLYTI